MAHHSPNSSSGALSAAKANGAWFRNAADIAGLPDSRFRNPFLNVELLGVGSEIEFERPRGSILRGEMTIGVGNMVGIQSWFVFLPRRGAAPARCRDQSIYDDMCHMHAAGPELAGEGLHQTAHGELRTAERQPASAAHAGGRASEEHGARAGCKHVGCGLSCAHEAAQCRNAPGLLERFGSGRQQSLAKPAAGVVNKNSDRPQLCADSIDRSCDFGWTAHIGDHAQRR